MCSLIIGFGFLPAQKSQPATKSYNLLEDTLVKCNYPTQAQLQHDEFTTQNTVSVDSCQPIFKKYTTGVIISPTCGTALNHTESKQNFTGKRVFATNRKSQPAHAY